jgi:adenine-specific DNA-methyltransferase
MIMSKLDVEVLGQVFTQDHTVDFMLKLRKNRGSVMEPSCGAGAFSDKLKNCVAIELDETVKPDYALNMDFFEYGVENKFNSIIGNPPFVKYKDFSDSTKALLANGKYNELFDERSNLYLFFIYKCVLQLKDGGELIFINPREFLKATSSINLNNFLYEQGNITNMVDLGDAKLFGNFAPNCVIWRFEKGATSRKTKYSTASLVNNKIELDFQEERDFRNTNGQLVFTKTKCTVPFNKLFYVKVGGVSGADELFAHPNGNKRFVNSETVSTGKTRRFFYNVEAPELLPHKQVLRNRKIKKFTDATWYMWGRNNYESKESRVYVNCKTRQENPFFTHSCKNFDGSVLGIFPLNQELDTEQLVKDFNNIDWAELGFVCDGRFIFSQKALENCVLPESFEKYLK